MYDCFYSINFVEDKFDLNSECSEKRIGSIIVDLYLCFVSVNNFSTVNTSIT